MREVLDELSRQSILGDIAKSRSVAGYRGRYPLQYWLSGDSERLY